MQTTPEPKGKSPARPALPPGPDEGQPGLWSSSPWRAILSYVLGPKQPNESPNKSPQRPQAGPSLARVAAAFRADDRGRSRRADGRGAGQSGAGAD